MEDFFEKQYPCYDKLTIYAGSEGDKSRELMVMFIRSDGALCQEKRLLDPNDCVARITFDGQLVQ